MNPSQRDLATISSTLFASLAADADEEKRLPSEVYVFQDLPVHHSKTMEFRSIVSGTTVDGCKIAVHELSLAPQSEPHPPHHHNGEEIFLMLGGDSGGDDQRAIVADFARVGCIHRIGRSARYPQSCRDSGEILRNRIRSAALV